MRILVLGGNGFVGQEIVDLLSYSNYADVIIASRNSTLSINLADYSNYKTVFKNNKFDIVICSVVSYSDFLPDALENVQITTNIIEYFKDKVNQIIFISSISALSENKYLSVYNHVKYLSEQVIEYYQIGGITNLTTLRFSQIIDLNRGSEMSQKGFHYIIDAIKKNEKLNIFSLNDSPRSYISVEYVAESVKYAIDNKISGFHNIVLKPFLTLKELVILLTENSKYNNQVAYIEREAIQYYIPKQSNSFKSFFYKCDMKEYLIKFMTK